ncbi:HDOD domain-containing protein [Cellulomonas sp. NPDC089187]|uniref:EAL and HDOD domain-containing protein n=1 Tax=Cellulomonas sp. NPDC089187 TaxID=3154970 RepID=UPI00341ADF1D
MTPVGVGKVTVQRQPVVRPDRSVYGYAVRVQVTDAAGHALPEDAAEPHVDGAYAALDLSGLASDQPVLLRATAGVLTGTTSVWGAPERLVLEISPTLARHPDIDTLVAAALARGSRVALADYDGSAPQDRLLDRVALVTIDLARSDDHLALLTDRALHAGVAVIAERADTTERLARAAALGADLLQGPMFQRDQAPVRRSFNAGELQCLELLRILSADQVDQTAVVTTVAADPELSMRVLHLVNSSAFGLRTEVDSVRQAVVLVGPRQLHALAIASLIDARPNTVAALWSVLTRAMTCRALAGDDAGYTVGLLSAVAAQQAIALTDLVDRTGVSDQLAAALLRHEGRHGQLLAAVLAHEENNSEAVAATGLEPWDVAHAYLAAVPQALATATSLAFGGN